MRTICSHAIAATNPLFSQDFYWGDGRGVLVQVAGSKFQVASNKMKS